jgi:hypothetical protein
MKAILGYNPSTVAQKLHMLQALGPIVGIFLLRASRRTCMDRADVTIRRFWRVDELTHVSPCFSIVNMVSILQPNDEGFSERCP